MSYLKKNYYLRQIEYQKQGIISKNQTNYINTLENNGFKVLISNNYDEIITTIIMYSLGIRYLIKNTKRKFRTIASRDKYLKLHKIKSI